MDPLRIYDYLTTVRRLMFDKIRSLPPESWPREFPIGLGRLDRTLTHMMTSEWYYIERMLQRAVPPYEAWPIRDESPPASAELEAAWTKQWATTRAALAEVSDWSAPIEYRVTDDDGVEQVVTASAADLFTQLVIHEAHHRAQALNMLRHLGVVFSDLDFNALMYDRRSASG